MPLQELTLPIPLSAGLDTKTDPKSVEAPRLTDLQNGIFTRGGTIAKRPGYAALGQGVDGTTSTITGGRALGRRGDELVQFAGGRLFSYRAGVDAWNDVGPAASIAHTEQVVAATGTNQQTPCSATNAGVRLVAWEADGYAFGGMGTPPTSTGGVWAAVLELATGRMLRPAWQVDVSGEAPRCVRVGDRIHLYWINRGAGQIRVIVMDPSAYSATLTPAVVAGDLASPWSFDACRSLYDTTMANLAYTRAADVRVAYIDAAGVVASLPAPPVDLAVAPQAGLAIAASATYVGLAYVDSGDAVIGWVLDAVDLSSIHTDTVAVLDYGSPSRIAAAFDDDDRLVIMAEGTTGVDRDSGVFYGAVSAGGLTWAGASTIRGHGIAARGFTDDGTAYFAVVHAVTFFPYVAILRVDDTDAGIAVTCAGRCAVSTSDGLPPGNHIPGAEQDADQTRLWRVMLSTRVQLTAAVGSGQFSEVAITSADLDFGSAEAFQTAEWGADLIIAGACPLRYDGDTVAELGFHTAPDDIAAPTVGAGGALTPSSTYRYVIGYEEADAAGVIHPGPVSIPIEVTLGASDTRVSFAAIPTYRLTGKRTARIVVWRTIADDPEADPTYYRVTSLNPNATAGDNTYLANDPTVDTVAFDDALDDASLQRRERCYASAGILSNDPQPVGHTMISAKGRLFWVDPTDRELVRFTQTRRDGYGPEIADLRIRIPGGAVRALAVLDDAILAFTAEQVWAFGGTGPLPDPEAAPQIGFTAPQLLAGAGDIGCTAPRSIVATPDWVFFAAARDRGIHQIDRSLAVGYVGAPVEQYNTIAIRSADLIPGSTRIVFLSDDSSGRALVFDFFFRQWGTFTNHRGIDAIVVGGVYHYLRGHGTVDERVFKTSGYTDGTSDVRLLIETAWIKLAGYHQGWQALWYVSLLGAWLSSHQLRVRVATDYRSGWDAPIDIDVDANRNTDPYGAGPYGAGPYGGATDELYQERIHLSLQCQAVRFQISDIPPAAGGTLGASFELTELLLSGGVPKRTATYSSGRSH